MCIWNAWQSQLKEKTITDIPGASELVVGGARGAWRPDVDGAEMRGTEFIGPLLGVEDPWGYFKSQRSRVSVANPRMMRRSSRRKPLERKIPDR